MTINLDTRKIVFFLLVYYLCLDPMMYMMSHYFTKGNILFGSSFFLYNLIYLEQIVFLLTIFFVATRTINTGQYLNIHSKLAFFLFTWVLLIVNVSFFDVGKVSFGQYYSFSTFIIARGFIFILLGLNIHMINEMFQKKKIRIVFYTIAAIYFGGILISAIFNPNAGMFSWYLDGIMRTTIYEYIDAQFDYLYISDTVALLLLLIMSRVKGMGGKLLVLIFGLFIILLTGSRTSFICFCFAGILLWAMISFKASVKKMLFPFALLVLLFTSAYLFGQFFIEQVTGQYGDSYRFAFVNMDRQSSVILRSEIFEKRWRDLEDVWLLGRYMAEVAEGRPGTYFHNWLSFWSAFGIGPFLLSIVLIISSLYRSARQLHKDSLSPTNQLLFLWTIFMVTAIVFSRAYSFYYIWFVLFGSSMINRKIIWKGGRQTLTSQTEKKLQWGNQNLL